jgi:hypothetical protein
VHLHGCIFHEFSGISSITRSLLLYFLHYFLLIVSGRNCILSLKQVTCI